MLRDTIIPWSLRLQIHERAVGEDGEEELRPEAIAYVLMDWIDVGPGSGDPVSSSLLPLIVIFNFFPQNARTHLNAWIHCHSARSMDKLEAAGSVLPPASSSSAGRLRRELWDDVDGGLAEGDGVDQRSSPALFMYSTLTLQVLPLLMHSCAIRSSRGTGIITLLHCLFISHPWLCMRSAIPPPYRSPSRSHTLDFSLLACTVCSLRLLLLAHFRYCFVSPSRHVSHSNSFEIVAPPRRLGLDLAPARRSHLAGLNPLLERDWD
ncbi:hypothetical protein B0H13DRAFT_2354828 [Mycena leptocephala]|nr:hypothetical protein B0H13DRAFT_2354828 [Mycena leptocephala]